MKKLKLPKKVIKISLFFIFLVLLAGLGYFAYQNRLLRRASKIPQSYEECFDNLSTESRKSDEIKYKCSYQASMNNSKVFQECLNLGGLRVPEVCALCPGCGCIKEHCNLTYYNPGFIIPEAYKECEENSGTGGSQNGIRYCEISFHLDGTCNNNRETAKSFINECKARGGETRYSHDLEGCILKYFED